METLQEKLTRILTASLADGLADLETLPNGHVCGDVVSSEFVGRSYEDRRQRIRKILQENLDKDELLSISTLLTYSPQEWSFEPKQS